MRKIRKGAKAGARRMRIVRNKPSNVKVTLGECGYSGNPSTDALSITAETGTLLVSVSEPFHASDKADGFQMYITPQWKGKRKGEGEITFAELSPEELRALPEVIYNAVKIAVREAEANGFFTRTREVRPRTATKAYKAALAS